MKRIVLLLVPTILVLYLVGTSVYKSPRSDRDASAPVVRVVSLSPSITEIIFALGCGDKLVGITDWCTWPPEAARIPSVGGHVDPNLEAVLSREPELVIVEAANTEVVEGLERLGVPTLVVEHRNIEGVLSSVDAIGRACGAAAEAVELRENLELRMSAVPAPAGRRTRVLVVVGRDASGGRLHDIFAASRGTFLDELLVAAGGLNVCDIPGVGYPTLSYEAIVAMAPEVILDLAPELADSGKGLAQLHAAWQALDTPASRTGRVHVLTDDGMLIPGPRIVDTIEAFAAALYPSLSEASQP